MAYIDRMIQLSKWPIQHLIALFCGLALLTSAAHAARDGARGATSSGSLSISLHVDPGVKISQLQDLQLRTNGMDASSAISNACVFVSDSGQYQLRASGSGPNQQFLLRNQQAQMPYQVHYDDGRGSQPVVAGSTLYGLHGADPISPDCRNTGSNGQIRVQVPSSALRDASPGNYAGTLTLLIAPD